MTYRISDNGIAFIERHEGCRLTAYRDGAGIWTIGVGHTGPNVVEGLTITQDQASAYLRLDLLTVERTLNELITHPVTQNQWDACVSLAFNIGPGNFAKSTVLRDLNEGDMEGAAMAFLMWTKDRAGDVEPGLVARRKSESALFLN